MSNYHAIATVTAAISQILEDVNKDVAGTLVTMKPPDAIGKAASDSLNLFLYQITPTTGYRDFDLPTRSRSGELISKPQLALDLHYLLTAYATDNDELQAQQILASAMRILHENPVLTREKIRKIIQSEPKIAGSDLADQVETIKISLQPLSMEETTKLWSSFFQTNYRISVAYQVTVVLLASKQEPKPTLPVQERILHVTLFRQPVIDKVEPQILERAKDAKITIIGYNLKASGVSIQFGKLKATPKIDDISDNQISIALPDTLTAGIKSIQLIHPLMLGKPETEHRGYESNVAAFVLAPRITTPSPIIVSPGGNLTFEFEPTIIPEQKVAVLIGDYTFSVPQRDPKSAPMKKLSIKIPEGFPTGEHLLRLRVDKAESFLKVVDGQFMGPKVTVG